MKLLLITLFLTSCSMTTTLYYECRKDGKTVYTGHTKNFNIVGREVDKSAEFDKCLVVDTNVFDLPK